jgi:hypothetical protein
MFIQTNFSALSKIKWNELATRFVFGGATTAIAGLIAKHYGPLVGGLFLAFPAIFPASATLLGKKQEQKKSKHGMPGRRRGIRAAAVEARGVAWGCVGLVCFALLIWKLIAGWNAGAVLGAATALWLIVSVALWTATRTLRHMYRRAEQPVATPRSR